MLPVTVAGKSHGCSLSRLSVDQQQLHDLKWLELTFLCFNGFRWNPMNLTCLVFLLLPQVTLQLLYQWFMHSSTLRYKHQVFSTAPVNQTWQLPALAWVRDLDLFSLWQVSPEINLICSSFVLFQKFQPEMRKHFLLNWCASAKYFANWKGFNRKVPVQFWWFLTPNSARIGACTDPNLKVTNWCSLNEHNQFPYILYQFR